MNLIVESGVLPIGHIIENYKAIVQYFKKSYSALLTQDTKWDEFASIETDSGCAYVLELNLQNDSITAY